MSQKENSVLLSFIWKLLERGAAQLITLVVQIVLARILAPDEFGVISILLVFINVANVFIQKGFASSLIRKPIVCDDDYNTALIVSEIIAVVCVGIFFIFSNQLETFYSIEGLSQFMRVLSVSLLFGAFYSIQNAELVRKMRFKQIFYRSMVASIGSGIIGIIAALLNCGVWALVLQSLFQQIIICVATMIACEWKPKLRFSKKSFSELFSFGSKILLAEIISIGVENLRTLIIGKKYTSTDLAYYDRGQVYPATAMRSIYDTISSVLLPVYSKIQGEKEKLAINVSISLELSMFIVAPLFFGLAAVAKPFIVVLLTDKWEAATPYLVIFCIYQIAFPAYGIFRQCLYALGKSDDVLKVEIVRSGIFILAIIIGVMFSPIAIAILSCLAMYITTVIYLGVVYKYIPIKITVLLRNIVITIIQCITMVVLIACFNRIELPNVLLLVIDIIIGTISYLLLSIFFKNKSFNICMSYIKKI